MIGGSEFRLVSGAKGSHLVVQQDYNVASIESSIMVTSLTDKIDIFAGGNLVAISKGNTRFDSTGNFQIKAGTYFACHAATLSEIKCAGSWVFESTTGSINILADIGNISAQTPVGIIELN
jgi:uncharacterized protein (DUF2345 family)